MNKQLVGWGSVLACLSVAIGAFGAHVIKARIAADMMEVFQTGVQYHMMHALGLIVIGIAAGHLEQPVRRKAAMAGGLLALGIVLFSGSLYALALSGIKVLGAITPLGGVSFLAGWLVFAFAVFRSRA